MATTGTRQEVHIDVNDVIRKEVAISLQGRISVTDANDIVNALIRYSSEPSSYTPYTASTVKIVTDRDKPALIALLEVGNVGLFFADLKHVLNVKLLGGAFKFADRDGQDCVGWAKDLMDALDSELNTRAVFEVTLKGFDGSTSDTDHLVKWVIANTLSDVNRLVQELNLELHDEPSQTTVSPEEVSAIDYDITTDGFDLDKAAKALKATP